jgi:hypothetical protein
MTTRSMIVWIAIGVGSLWVLALIALAAVWLVWRAADRRE